jgi:hypothetical protein
MNCPWWYSPPLCRENQGQPHLEAIKTPAFVSILPTETAALYLRNPEFYRPGHRAMPTVCQPH